jgi:hypothetical protein
MKPVGKPDAGNRHVRFDERGWETGRPFASVLASILDSTTASSRNAGEGRGYEARDSQRAEAYLNNTLSTVAERNDVDMALSRVAAEGA